MDVKEHSMSGKHALIMALCCLFPLAAIFLVSVLGIPLSSLGTVALVLLCPLLHVFMMRGMGGHSHGSQGQPSCHDAKAEPVAAPATRTAGQLSHTRPHSERPEAVQSDSAAPGTV